MIKDIELRRGNRVITKTTYNKPIEIKVLSILADGINETNGHIIPFEDLVGIELTREHLIAWGFEIPAWAKEPNIYERGFEGITGELLPDGFHLIEIEYENLKPQKYVHQMQNLILDLCGDELV